MPTSFHVISLGNLAEIDTVEGNQTAENAASLVGQSFGAPQASLVNDIVSFSAAGTGFGGGVSRAYDMNNAASNDQFSIDGGPAQTFDGTAIYNATVTYIDGSSDTITAVVFQDTDGNTYLAPEFSSNADQTALEAGAIRSVSLDSLNGSTYAGMSGTRETFDFVTCFLAGTHIETETGPLAVENLHVGDAVLTRDHGLQCIRWIGQSTRAAYGRFRPVRVAAGALAEGRPVRDLYVSQQHRLLITSRIAKRMTGSSEVLIPAKKLLGCDGVEFAEDVLVARYYHLLFDRHEVIFAEGTPTESLLTGPTARAEIGEAAFADVIAVFPDILRTAACPARTLPKGHQIRSLVQRHIKNEKPFL